MRSPLVYAGLFAAALSVASLAAPASGAARVKPKAGNYSAPALGGYPSFSVGKHLKTVSNFIATAPTAKGCKISGGYAVSTLKVPLRHGHFSMSSSAYGGPAVTAGFNGTFVTPTKVKGHLIVHYKNPKHKSCNANTKYTATRVK